MHHSKTDAVTGGIVGIGAEAIGAGQKSRIVDPAAAAQRPTGRIQGLILLPLPHVPRHVREIVGIRISPRVESDGRGAVVEGVAAVQVIGERTADHISAKPVHPVIGQGLQAGFVGACRVWSRQIIRRCLEPFVVVVRVGLVAYPKAAVIHGESIAQVVAYQVRPFSIAQVACGPIS